MTVDMEGFHRLLTEQKQRAKAARKNAGAEAWLSDAVDFTGIEKTRFIGYQALSCEAKILTLVKDGRKTDRLF